jgi:crotonobetainyl-CoA:carnitine CoA-transferase CaiB-like acyl-CoA transferase
MSDAPLGHIRVLDLSDDKGALCGKIFADLGADVIKVEPLEGSPTRRIPPFLDDSPGLDSSLYFIAYEAGKRSATLNLERADARELLRALAVKADFLIESFQPGYMDTLGLGFEHLAALNQRLVYVSITPFGDRGPGRNYRAADIVVWAAGGVMYLMGEPERAPLQMSLPQAGLLAGAEAAVAALLAYHARLADDLGQHVVIDMQACVVWMLMNEQAMPVFHGAHLERSGRRFNFGFISRRLLFRCADGYVSALVIGGPNGAPSTRALVQWMAEKGFASDWMLVMDWVSWVPGFFMQATERDLKEVAELEDAIERFFMTMNKQEIYAEAIKRRILIAPVYNVAEIAEDEQLRARDFFAWVANDVLDRTLVLPGPFARFSLTPLKAPRRPPMLGEHNMQVYGDLLRLSPVEISRLRACGAI